VVVIVVVVVVVVVVVIVIVIMVVVVVVVVVRHRSLRPSGSIALAPYGWSHSRLALVIAPLHLALREPRSVSRHQLDMRSAWLVGTCVSECLHL